MKGRQGHQQRDRIGCCKFEEKEKVNGKVSTLEKEKFAREISETDGQCCLPFDIFGHKDQLVKFCYVSLYFWRKFS